MQSLPQTEVGIIVRADDVAPSRAELRVGVELH